MHTCAIISCSSHSQNNSDVSLFRIPKKEAEAKGWIQFITEANSGVAPNNAISRVFICSKHFRNCCLYPYNPRRSRLANGHFPSVVDGKVILNENSKCRPISTDEKLQIYDPPTYRNQQEKQRAYLVQQLTSFNVQRTIVIGAANKNRRTMKNPDKNRLRNENRTKTTKQSQKDVLQCAAAVHPIKRFTRQTAAYQFQTADVDGMGKNKRTSTATRHCGKAVLRKDMKHPQVTVLQQDTVTTMEIKSEPGKVSRGLRSTRPSKETKMKLLIRDNSNLRRSMHMLQKRVEEMENEMKRLRNGVVDVESRYQRLIKRYKKRLNLKRKAFTPLACVETQMSNCKCSSLSVEVVDISQD